MTTKRAGSLKLAKAVLDALRYREDDTNEFSTDIAGLAVQVTKADAVSLRLRIRGVKHAKIAEYDRHGGQVIYTAGEIVPFDLRTFKSRVEAIRAQWEAEAIAPKVPEKPPVPTVRAVMADYRQLRIENKPIVRTKRSVQGLPKHWDTQVAPIFELIYASILDTPMDQLNRHILEKCQLDYLETHPGSYSTLLTNWKTIMPMFRYAAKMYWFPAPELLDLRPVSNPDPDEDGTRDRFLLPGEWQAIRPVLDTMIHERGLFVRFLFAVGCRLSMAREMTWGEIEYHDVGVESFPTMAWVITDPDKMKMGQLHITPVVGEARAIIERCNELYSGPRDAEGKPLPNARVFPSQILTGFNRNGIQRTWRWLYKRTGTKNWHRHDERRSCVTWMGYALLAQQMSRMDAREIAARVLAHKTVTDLYFKVTDVAEIIRGYLALDGLMRAVETGTLTVALQAMQRNLPMNTIVRKMMNDFEVESKFLKATTTATVHTLPTAA